MSISVPTVAFTDERLPNGLRLIVAEDHLAPVVAINVWYDVGSKHEQPGKTGFAHLFEHVMFQGSRHVAKAEHIALIQAAGGTMNGTTWLDRTNYFETLPSHQLELGLWLEADRMATLLDALSQENLDNQREVVKNEKRWSYDNRPYGSWQEKLQGHLFPAEHPYHHSTIGSMEDLDAASLEDVSAFFRDLLRAQQRGAVGRRRRRHRGRSGPACRTLLRRHPGQSVHPARCADLSLPPTLGGERRETSTTGSRCRASTSASGRRCYGDPRLDALDVAGADPGRRQGQPAAPPARARRADRPGRGAVHPRVRRRRVGLRRLGDRPPRRQRRTGSRPPSTRSSSDWPRNRSPTTSWPGPSPSSRPTSWARSSGSEERADRLSHVRDAVRRPGAHQPDAAALPGRHAADAIREVAAATFRPDNRLVLTYLPEVPPAESDADDADADGRRVDR